MNLRLSEEQDLVRATFARLFAEESTPDRVRAAETTGFDPELYASLVSVGAPGLRVPAARGGAGGNLLDAALVVEEAGRRLASVPVVEAMVALSVLADVDEPAATRWLEGAIAGERIVTLDVACASDDPLIPAGAVAHGAIGFFEGELVLLSRAENANAVSVPTEANLGCSALARRSVFDASPLVLRTGDEARALYARALIEWQLLTAASLTGLGREALEMAARHAGERHQFGRPIGSFQGIAHPLADSAAEVEGARLLNWKAIAAIARKAPNARSLVSMGFYWASRAASRAAARALHVFGGYGLSLEEDIQLYHRRAKAWSIVAGDPEAELDRVAERFEGDLSEDRDHLPEAGHVGIDFSLGAEAQAFSEQARAFFEAHWDEEQQAHRHYAWEGYHPGFWKKLAGAGFLFPAWPEAYGGQARSRYEMQALARVFFEFGCTRHPIDTTGMVASALMAFGSEELKKEVLPLFAGGEAICSLGYSEPGSGSDVAAAQTRAQFDGENWRLDGQKMFTSGANLGHYVFLLTRTNPDVAKHRGLTLFLVPLELPGVEVRPFETLSDERTNATYYSDVELSDRYRVGEVDGGWQVLAHALELEHGKGVVLEQEALLAGALVWAQGRAPVDTARRRLARTAVHTEVADGLNRAALYAQAEGLRDRAIGPMAKFFSTDRFIEDASDLMDLCAPDSLLRGRFGGGSEGVSAVEFAYRLSTATSIYGGTSEIMKSIVAQESLGLPRSRS